MIQPNNIFSFEHELVLYIYIAIGNFSIDEFDDFTDKYSGRHIPDSVKVFYPEYSILSDQLEEIEHSIKARFKCTPKFYKFDVDGQFDSTNGDVEIFLEKATERILEQRNPIVAPPPGTAFSKPSGERESFFIRASNLFVRHAEISFLGLLLIRKWGEIFNTEVNTIYVDTIDLYGLTSLACRMKFFGENHFPITVTYSSYDAYKKILDSADVSRSLMLISATTSHNLQKRIVRETKWRDICRIVTILDLEDENYQDNQGFNKNVIAHLSHPTPVRQLHLLPSLRLAGENFSLDIDDPKSVLLNVKNHGLCLEKLNLHELSKMTNVLRIYSRFENGRIPISINSRELVQHPIFTKWLKEAIEKFAPISTKFIVLLEDLEDEFLSNIDLGNAKLDFIDQNKLTDQDLDIQGSVIVISLCFSTGARLLEVSRDLRKYGNLKSIVYFTGVGTPSSATEFKQLKSNLTFGSFQLYEFLNLYTGIVDGLNSSWEAEVKFLKDHIDLDRIPQLKLRKETIDHGELDDNNLYYKMEELELNENFGYWKPYINDYNTQGVLPAKLLLVTFAFILQNARSDSTLPSKDSLLPLSSRQVLIDPENFFRFNDSLIQVTILRTALPRELDYSNQEEHSASIFYLINRSLQMKQHAVIYELLLALATNRLRITQNKCREVGDLIRSSSIEECTWFDEKIMSTQ